MSSFGRTGSPSCRWILQGSLAVLAYTYVGYPLLITVAARLARGRSSRRAAPATVEADLTVVIAAWNEEQIIAAKIDDTRRQEYGPGRLHIIVVADGSSDRTADIAREKGVQVLHEARRRGKTSAVNRGIAASRSEFVCLTDANCFLAPAALQGLTAPFFDERVAVVSGVKSVTGPGVRGRGEGLYWRLETATKVAESVFGAVMGAPGELCGLRRAMTRPIPQGIVNDDYHLTCDALARSLVVRVAPGAVAYEQVSPRTFDEFERRTRIAAGTWQTTLGHLTLADPRRGWVALAFISHRVLRSLLAPALLPALLVQTFRCSSVDRLARLLLIAQASAWVAALAGVVTDSPAAAVPFQFALTNLATLRGGARYLTGRQPAAWRVVR